MFPCPAANPMELRGASAWAGAALLLAVRLLGGCTALAPPPSPLPCSARAPSQPCLLEDACARAGPRRVECWAKVSAYSHIEDSFSWPTMDLNVTVLEAIERAQMHFVQAIVHMDAIASIERESSYTQVDMSLQMSEKAIDLLNDLRRFEIALSAFVDIVGVISVPDSNGLLLDLEILHSADWKINVFKAECNDPDTLNSNWNILEKKLNLTHLFLQGCFLNFHLEMQPYLQNLEIVSCNLLDLPMDFFENTPNILSLSLSSSNLTTLLHGISYLKNLQRLELIGNNLISINFFATLHLLTNLQMLRLSKTHIASLYLLDPVLNTSSLQLTSLHLLECQLPSLQEEDIILLSKQTKLEELDLSNNKIDYIPSNWSYLPGSVKILNLSSNFLASVQFMFSPEVELNVIDISNNKLRVLGDILLIGRTEFLNISYNHIIEVHDVNYGRSINHLNLSHNLIQNVTEVFVSSMKTLHSLDLGGNFFSCQVCNITILQKWISGQHNVKIMALNGSGELLCFPKHHNLKVAVVRQEECKTMYSRNPEWARVFQISLVLSLIFLTVVLLRGYKFETCYLMRLWQNRTNKSRNTSLIHRYDAFVCYSNADRDWVVNELMRTLEESPHYYRFCDHERDFTLGSFISQNILQSMHLSRHILFVLSETFLNSQWCLWELEMARHREFEGGGSSPILLQLTPLDQLNLPDSVEILLDSCRALHKPNETFFWNKLVNMLGPSLANSADRN